ncbi:2-dehydro-3-deoxygluconokinase [Lentibacillus persicus]|uniref:2-dehydro-3-deoxygluconokinase n=1 Tax=Lentibacillus persicus TaxID=640948 RepID=A0A1I1YPQ9_9BACI|nr:sugar kinase [Lentibacillus persicus]SFE21584.1 2-dehydro-3-deoxygluconokinase [Lentibacillus persicus]
MGKVITFGELMLRLTPNRKGRLNQASEFKAYYGGAEANVAMSLSKFGHDTGFLSAFPQNDIGDAAISHLSSGGVDTAWVFRQGERLGTYYYEEGYSLKQAKVIYDREHSAIHQLPELPLDWQSIYRDVDLLHITGITPALSKPLKDLTLEAVQAANEYGVKVSFDFNFRGKLWTADEAKETFLVILTYADICFAGYKDFIHLLGEDGPETFSETHLAKFYEDYAKQYNIDVFASTDRQVMSASQNRLRGFIYQNGQFVQSETFSFELLERIGGGDAFAAGILHGLLKQMDPSETVEFGTASGVLKHMVYGDHNQYTETEVQDFLKHYDQDVSR